MGLHFPKIPGPTKSLARPNNMMGPLYTRVQLEAQTCNYWEFDAWIWHAFFLHLMLLRGGPIFKLSTIWPSVKWSYSKWDIKGGGVGIKPMGVGDKPKNVWAHIWQLELSSFLNNLHETTLDFDPQELIISYQELIINVLHGIHKAPS